MELVRAGRAGEEQERQACQGGEEEGQGHASGGSCPKTPTPTLPPSAFQGDGPGLVGSGHGLRNPASVRTFWPCADCTSSMKALAALGLGAFLRRAIG